MPNVPEGGYAQSLGSLSPPTQMTGHDGTFPFAARCPPEFPKQPGEASMRTFCAALFIVAMMAPASAYTDEQVSACTPDVMRLCADAIPDEGRITKCMVQKKKQVSATCMMVMKKGPSPTSRVAVK
jgi:hypothetical protein